MQCELVERLFSLYREPVYRFLRRLLGDDAIAEELTQETFLRALGADYYPDGRERAWVFSDREKPRARPDARCLAHAAARLEDGALLDQR